MGPFLPQRFAPPDYALLNAVRSYKLAVSLFVSHAPEISIEGRVPRVGDVRGQSRGEKRLIQGLTIELPAISTDCILFDGSIVSTGRPR